MDTKKRIEKFGNQALPPPTYDAPEFVVARSDDEYGTPINFPLAGWNVVAGYGLCVGISNKVPTHTGDLEDLPLEPGSTLIAITTDMVAKGYYQSRTAAGAFSSAQWNGVKNGRAYISFIIYDQDGHLVGASHIMPIKLALPQSTTE